MSVSASVYIDFAGAMVGELCRKITKLSIIGDERLCQHKATHRFFFAQSCFRYQLTVVGNVTMQLSKVTVLDNVEAVYINVVNRDVCGSMSVHHFLCANPLFVLLVKGYKLQIVLSKSRIRC